MPPTKSQRRMGRDAHCRNHAEHITLCHRAMVRARMAPIGRLYRSICTMQALVPTNLAGSTVSGKLWPSRAQTFGVPTPRAAPMLPTHALSIALFD